MMASSDRTPGPPSSVPCSDDEHGLLRARLVVSPFLSSCWMHLLTSFVAVVDTPYIHLHDFPRPDRRVKRAEVSFLFLLTVRLLTVP